MNAESSRSHAIFTIILERSEKGPDGQQHLRMGKLHMVDLAVRKKMFLISMSAFPVPVTRIPPPKSHKQIQLNFETLATMNIHDQATVHRKKF